MNEINLELYRIFETVATLKSITKASKALYISQPAVTMNIQKLEEQLNMTLFIRTRKGVSLTSEGSVLYEYVKQAMESIRIGENKMNSLKELETGNIRIGIGTTLTKFFLTHYLEKFHVLYPKVSIHIDTSPTSQILKDLENGKIDMAIITGESSDYKGFNIKYSQEMEYIFIGNKKYSEIASKRVNLTNLNQYPLLLQGTNTNTRQFLDNFLSSKKIKLNSIMDLASYSLVIEFSKIGMGIGFIAKDYVKNEIEKGELIEIKTNPSIPKREILVLVKKDYLPSFSVAKLIEMIKE